MYSSNEYSHSNEVVDGVTVAAVGSLFVAADAIE